jgi:hypothetical protein
MARRVRIRSSFAVTAMLVSASVLIIAEPALAKAPQAHQSSFQFSGVVNCRSFVDRYTDRYSIVGRTYFDHAGTAVRIIDHVRHTSTDRNSVTGLVVHQHDRYNIVTEVRTGILRVSGGLFRINRPGRGMVIHDVGRVVMDKDGNLIFTAGRHQVLGNDSTVFCSALA